MSSLAWLSYSEAERRKALDVISLFREQDTRDELGIGVIRDAFADLLFPGTSTIQRRARYFLFIPWTYQKLEDRRIRSVEVAERARREEVAVIEELIKSGEKDGVIGIEARQTLKRLPSNIYWQGLGRWGIRLYPGSMDQYHRSLDGFYLTSARSKQERDEEPSEPNHRRNWHASLPPRPDAFPQGASFQLTRQEAEYLRERVLVTCPGTMLAFLLDEGKPSESVEFPWDHPQYGELSARIREQLLHARNFSEVIHGSALLYNLLLAKKKAASDLVREYRQRLEDWATGVAAAGDRIATWDRRRFWDLVLVEANARASIPSRQFVDAWIDLTLKGDQQTIATNRHATELIHERERTLKRGQARLDNRRALELWGGAAGADQLDYRWGVVQAIVTDIQQGLRRAPSRA